MRYFFFILTFLYFGNLYCVAQKVIEKEFSAAGLHSLFIEDDAIFNIKITATERESIKLKVRISGENSEAIIIEESYSEGKLSLKTGLLPFFSFQNDKLAAHKVIAVEMEILIPNTISIEVKSKLASLETIGPLANLAVFLYNGNCISNNFSGNAHIKTVNGNITVQAATNVLGFAISENGKVENLLKNNGKFILEAESINGNIMLLQTK